MSKIFKTVLAFLTLAGVFSSVSCGKDDSEIDEKPSVVITDDTPETPETTEDSDKSDGDNGGGDPAVLELHNSPYTELKHENAFLIDLENVDLTAVDFPENSTVVSMTSVRDKMIVRLFFENDPETAEIGVYYPYANEYNTISKIKFGTGYNDYSCVVQDRYYAMIYFYDDGANSGHVYVYDAETGESENIADFDSKDMVQYITPVGENGLAWFYYESGTEDWIVKYYDLETKDVKEVFRYADNGDISLRPVDITADGDDIVLAAQSETGSPVTQFFRISDGEYKIEEIDLNEFYGGYYMITDIAIKDGLYCVKGGPVHTSEEYLFFERKNDDFYVVIPAICRLRQLVGEEINDMSDMLFLQSQYDTFGDLIHVDLANGAFDGYDIWFGDKAADVVNVELMNNGDLVVFARVNGEDILYQTIVNDYRFIDKTPMNPGIYTHSDDFLDDETSYNDYKWNFLRQE